MLSKRRAIALDKSSVKKKLSLPCSCAKNCQKQFSVQEILYWRQRIHCIPAGEERIKKLAEMIQLCAITIRKYERDSLYRINQKLCCRWVLYLQRLLYNSKCLKSYFVLSMHLVYFKDISSRRLCLAYPYQHLQEPNELFKKTDMTLMSGLQGLGQMELGVLLLMCLIF